MGGEGSMAAANTSLKNNRSQLAKRKDKKVLSGSYAHAKMKEFPEASPKTLEKIKARMQQENEAAGKKVFLGFVFLFLVAIVFLYFILV